MLRDFARGILAGVALIAGAWGWSGASVAQDSTPIVVLVEGCPAQESDLIRVASFAGTPAPEHAAQVETRIADLIEGSPTAAVEITGPVPDDETVAAVTEALELWVGCFNTNDPLFRFSVYTDAYLVALAEMYGPLHPQLAVLDGRVVNPLPEKLQLSLSSVEQIVMIDDGRLAVEALVIDRMSVFGDAEPNATPGAGTTVRIVLVFTQDADGRWLVDGEQLGGRPYMGVLMD